LFLDAMAKGSEGGRGALWWIERELAEAKKYMPKRRLN